MPQLTIIADDGTELLKVQISKIDPQRATIVILEALAKEQPTKRQRSDAGKKRQPRLVLPPAASLNGGAT